MKKTIALLVIISLFLPGMINAQEVKAETKDRTGFKLGAFYNSNLNYYGRTDSLQSSGFFPLAEIWFNKNLYINAAPVFTSNALNRFEYAGTVLTAGYQVKSENEKFFTHLYFTKPFYRKGTQLVQSTLKEQLSGTFSWLNKYVNFSIGGDIKHVDGFDFGFNAGIDHVFRHEFPGQFIFVADPAATINIGTQHFTRTYYEKKGILFLPGTEQAVSKQEAELKVLSYELTLPLILSRNKWQLLVIPAYVIPENLLSVSGNPELSERGEQMFYITAGVKINF
ncbi:MAG TPA: hypothetical protein VFI06_10725 [Chitinophagaceae bacterium]|nr:hypothetical protein [Chitinophagaceae bacterium]